MRLIATLAIVVCSLFTPAVLAADEKSCIKHEAHEGLTFTLIDRTDKGRNAESLSQTILRVKELVQPGERIVFAALTARANDTRVILDLVRPKKDLWESPLKTKAKDRAFLECIATVEKSLEANQEEHKNSAILETLGFVAKVFAADSSTARRLVVHSDMIQNSESFSFISAKTVDPEASIKRAIKEGLIPSLTGVAVTVAGAGEGISDQKARQLEQFWKGIFKEAGAELKYYGPVMAAG